jgi:hypothetical protein
MDDSVSVSWELVYKISCNWRKCWSSTSFYLESCIWPDAISRWIRQRVCIKFYANIGESSPETLPMIIQAFGEESVRRTRKIEWHTRFRADRKKERQVKSKAKSMLTVFIDVKRILNKEFVLTHKTVNSAYYFDTLWRMHENVRRLRPELWKQKNLLLHHDNASSHTFGQKQYVVPTYPTFLSLPDWR